MLEANKVADSTVFVSNWLKELFLSHGLKDKNIEVILGGANSKIFNSEGYTKWTPEKKLKNCYTPLGSKFKQRLRHI